LVEARPGVLVGEGRVAFRDVGLVNRGARDERSSDIRRLQAKCLDAVMGPA
jgi:hypothetical protein